MSGLFKWQVLDADENVLVLYSCKQDDSEVNSEGMQRWWVEDEIRNLKKLEQLVFDSPKKVLAMRTALGSEPIFHEAVNQLSATDT